MASSAWGCPDAKTHLKYVKYVKYVIYWLKDIRLAQGPATGTEACVLHVTAACVERDGGNRVCGSNRGGVPPWHILANVAVPAAPICAVAMSAIVVRQNTSAGMPYPSIVKVWCVNMPCSASFKGAVQNVGFDATWIPVFGKPSSHVVVECQISKGLRATETQSSY